MSHNAPARWIVTYDIAHPRRWAPIYKLLKKKGVPLQYSVFQVDASAAHMGALMAEISKLIDRREDDVRAYRVPESGTMYTLGSPMIPEGMWITADPKQAKS